MYKSAIMPKCARLFEKLCPYTFHVSKSYNNNNFIKQVTICIFWKWVQSFTNCRKELTT